MTKERYDKLQIESIYGGNDPSIRISEKEKLTQEEWEQGYHYCFDWDGLFIGPESKEWECCTCHPLRDIINGMQEQEKNK